MLLKTQQTKLGVPGLRLEAVVAAEVVGDLQAVEVLADGALLDGPHVEEEDESGEEGEVEEEGGDDGELLATLVYFAEVNVREEGERQELLTFELKNLLFFLNFLCTF